MSSDACDSMGELIVCDDMVDSQSYMRSLALVLGLTSQGEVLGGHLFVCDDTACRWMVSSLMCTLIYRPTGGEDAV